MTISSIGVVSAFLLLLLGVIVETAFVIGDVHIFVIIELSIFHVVVVFVFDVVVVVCFCRCGLGC